MRAVGETRESSPEVLPLDSWAAYLAYHLSTFGSPEAASVGKVVDRISVRIGNILNTGGRLLVAGNGGSSSDANHIVGELVAAFAYERPALDVVSLCSNTTILTAWANDFGIDTVFSRQVQAHCRSGDALLLLSTSGESSNILRAAEVAQEIGGYVVGLTGAAENSLSVLCDDVVHAPTNFTPTVQEFHVLVYHFLCAAIERECLDKSESIPKSRYQDPRAQGACSLSASQDGHA